MMERERWLKNIIFLEKSQYPKWQNPLLGPWQSSLPAGQSFPTGQPVWDGPHGAGGVQERWPREGVTTKGDESMAREGLGNPHQQVPQGNSSYW